jgi:hypothetical protein
VGEYWASLLRKKAACKEIHARKEKGLDPSGTQPLRGSGNISPNEVDACRAFIMDGAN